MGFLKPNSSGSRANNNPHKFSSSFDQPKMEMPHSITTPPFDLATAPRHKGIKHMSRVELEERRRKGLCFKCGQQYSPLHKCPEGKFRILLLSDDEGLDESGEIIQTNYDMGEEETEEGECQILNFMGMANSSIQPPKTLKLKGELRGIPIQVLVDSGASHNFISHKLVSLQSLPTQQIGRWT